MNPEDPAVDDPTADDPTANDPTAENPAPQDPIGENPVLNGSPSGDSTTGSSPGPAGPALNGSPSGDSTTGSSPGPAGPLEGLLVVDLSRYLPGPLAAQILASLGARVIKVEEPSLGDPVRLAPSPKGGPSPLAAPLLAGVESVALDLKKPAGVAVLQALLEGADVLLETFRPGGLARMGLAPEELRRRYARLVVCSLSGWGQEGPHAGRAGHDLTYQALAGSLASMEARGKDPPKLPAVPGADVLGAWSAATAILAALHERQTTGEGKWIDASLFDAAVHSNLVGWASEPGRPHRAGEPHDLSGALASYNLYRTKDGGTVALALLEPHFWKRFVKALGRKDLKKLHLDRNPQARRQVAELMASCTRAEWADFFQRHDLPAEPLLSAAEAKAHPQAQSRKILSQGPDGLPRLAFPARFDGHRPTSNPEVPSLGQHTAEVLAQLRPSHPDLPKARRGSGVGKSWGLKRLLAKLVLKG